MVRTLKPSRRAFVAGVAAAAVPFCTLLSPPALALGRIPFGGKLRLALPFAMTSLDPHDLRDPLSALLGSAVFDSPYAMTSSGATYPSLLATPIESVGGGLGLRLRPGLKDSRGTTLTSRDLQFSLERAALGAAKPLLAPFGAPRRDAKDTNLVVYPKGDADALARALSSPMVALVHRSFDAKAPRGTGAFQAHFELGGLKLTRNPNAARGGSFLDGIDVQSTPNLADALRLFEAGEVDLGWLGRGLHRARPNSKLFRSPRLGWLLLHSSERLGGWGAPGTAQRVLASVDGSRLERFGLRLPAPHAGAPYAGPPCELSVRNDSPYLVELAAVLAELLGRPGSEVTVHSESAGAVEKNIATGRFDFALELVRSLGSTQEQDYAGLQLAARLTPRGTPRLPQGLSGLELALHATSGTRTAVLSEFAVVGAHMPEHAQLGDWDLSNVYSQRQYP